jgi:site-specific DNA-methyltransferase (adenine-specific)
LSVELLNIDCMEYMATLPDKYFDLALSDPPYFNGPQKLGFYGGRCLKTGVDRNGYKKLGQWNVPGADFFAELQRVSKNQIIWGINYYAIENLGSGRIIWNKVNTASTFSDCEIAYCSAIEHVRMITYMWNGMLQGKSIKDGHIQQGNKQLNEKRIHPTQKPVCLYQWQLNKYAEPGQRILDTHLGSGSSAIAAHYFGCDFVGCEIDAEYWKNGLDRFDRETRQFAMEF